MPKGCVKKKVDEGMTTSQAVKFCYPNMKKLDMKKVEGRLKKLENPRSKMKSTKKDTTRKVY